ncbi:MAG: TlpA family protein disulfide reductase [Cellulophaga sp.]
MKKIFITKQMILFLSLLLVTITSCKQKIKQNYTIVSGKIINSDSKNIKINSFRTSIAIDTVSKIERVVTLDNQGMFVDTLEINNKREFLVNLSENKNFNFWINPGKDIHFNVDVNDVKNSLTFSGEEGIKNTYFINKKKIQNLHSEAIVKFGRKYDKDGFKKQQKFYNDFLELLNTTTGLDSQFIEDEKKDLYYNFVRGYFYQALVAKIFSKGEKIEYPSNFEEIILSVNMEDSSEYKRSEIYDFLLRDYYQYKFSQKEKTNDIATVDYIQFLKETISNQYILDEVIMMGALTNLTYTEDMKGYNDVLMSTVSNTIYRDTISSIYNKLLTTYPGQPSPEFVDYRNIDGSKTSLKDFKGKYVYIDVWATWCGPCIKQFPFLKKIEEKYHNNDNIVFISLSVDTDRAYKKWQDYVKGENLGGIQIIADKALQSKFITDYQIKAIPRFILIDPEGKIVSANAPRPSDEKIINLFNSLNI